MELKTLLAKNRSYRRFREDFAMERRTLVELVASTRSCPSGANRQPLKYFVVCTPEENARVFPHLGWAKWLPDWSGPAEGERPTGYIVILGDRRISHYFDYDAGIAAFTILLAATELGLGGCMVGWIDRGGLAATLSIPDHLEILLVVALGKPKETVVLEDIGDADDFAYWRDAAGTLHVPKRPLEELLVGLEPPVLAAVLDSALSNHAEGTTTGCASSTGETASGCGCSTS
jgi:nitroreductase